MIVEIRFVVGSLIDVTYILIVFLKGLYYYNII
jgi:hypothetical protein